jgi:hypothetical protein
MLIEQKGKNMANKYFSLNNPIIFAGQPDTFVNLRLKTGPGLKDWQVVKKGL